jgi:hypothetical protein
MENNTFNLLNNSIDNSVENSVDKSVDNSVDNFVDNFMFIDDCVDDSIDDRIQGLKKVSLQFEKDKKKQLKFISNQTNSNISEINTFFDLQNKDFVFYEPTDLNTNQINVNELEVIHDFDVNKNESNINKDITEEKQQFQEFKWNDVENLDKKRKALLSLEQQSTLLELEQEFKLKNGKKSKKDKVLNSVNSNANANELKKPTLKSTLLSKSSNIIDNYNVPYHFLIIILMMSLIYVMYITVGLATSYLKLNS